MTGKMVIPKISAELPEQSVDPFGYATHECSISLRRWRTTTHSALMKS